MGEYKRFLLSYPAGYRTEFNLLRAQWMAELRTTGRWLGGAVLEVHINDTSVSVTLSEPLLGEFIDFAVQSGWRARREDQAAIFWIQET